MHLWKTRREWLQVIGQTSGFIEIVAWQIDCLRTARLFPNYGGAARTLINMRRFGQNPRYGCRSARTAKTCPHAGALDDSLIPGKHLESGDYRNPESEQQWILLPVPESVRSGRTTHLFPTGSNSRSSEQRTHAAARVPCAGSPRRAPIRREPLRDRVPD